MKDMLQGIYNALRAGRPSLAWKIAIIHAAIVFATVRAWGDDAYQAARLAVHKRIDTYRTNARIRRIRQQARESLKGK